MRSTLAATLLACGVGIICGQNPRPADRLEFEVATVKPSAEGATGCNLRPAPGGEHYIASCLPLRPIIWTSFWLKADQVVGGPSWIDTDRYDLDGLATEPSSIDDLHVMMQNLLADRFRLQFHHETRELPVYVLTVDKNGPKNMREQAAANASDLRIDQEQDGLRQTWRAQFAPMAFFAWRLSQNADRPIVDQTGLDGNYAFDFEFSLEPPRRNAAVTPGVPQPLAPLGMTMFEALPSQLGLKLEARKAPVDIIVIDRVERPTDN
jgi:uncharacterized protein (TIGR03435 family)